MLLASAYTNSFDGAAATMLFNLDAASDTLTLQAPPNDGTLVDIGALGVDISGTAAFDIAGGADGLALAALRSGASGPFTLYSVSLTTGGVTLYRNTSGNAALNQIGGAPGRHCSTSRSGSRPRARCRKVRPECTPRSRLRRSAVLPLEAAGGREAAWDVPVDPFAIAAPRATHAARSHNAPPCDGPRDCRPRR